MKASDLIAALQQLSPNTTIIIGDGRILYIKPTNDNEKEKIYVLPIKESANAT